MKLTFEKAAFAQRLKRHRIYIGLTQKQMAEELGVDRSAYAYYEGGRSAPSLEKLVKISNMFGMTVDKLLGNSEKALKLNESAKSATNFKLGSIEMALSQEERELVVSFRKLQVDNQEKIKATIKELDEQGRAKYKQK